jgi:hypothetical protein
MAELAATRAEVAEAAAADAVRAAAAELEALHGSSISSSVSADAGTDDELKLAREPAREHTAQWAVAHPQGRSGGSHGDDESLLLSVRGSGLSCGRGVILLPLSGGDDLLLIDGEVGGDAWHGWQDGGGGWRQTLGLGQR